MTQNVDTPDYQRGVVNAQVLLATVPGGTSTVTVGVPPNTETLVVIVPGAAANTGIFCTGVVTGVQYSGVKSSAEPLVSETPTWWFDVSAVVDASVKVSLTVATADVWYVYADAGTHTVADISKLVSNLGVQYQIPTVPATDLGDHPPTEVTVSSAYISSTSAIIAAPGAGLRLRIFSAQLATVTAGLLGYVLDNAAGRGLAACAGAGNSITTFPGQGYPMSTNSALEYEVLAGSGSMWVAVVYTTETV